MKKPFKHTKVGKFLRSKVFKTVADVAIGTFAPAVKLGGGVLGGLIGGVGQAVNNEKKANLESGNGGIGRPNWARIVGYLVLAALTVMVIRGDIDEDTFYALWDVWQDQTPE